MTEWADLRLILTIVVFLSTLYPLVRAWQTQAATSLRHVMGWLGAAWLAWLATGLTAWGNGPLPPVRYLALVLSAAAAVAVLGARRPGFAAWNLVVAGLLAVFSLPLLEQPWSSPGWRLDAPRALFLAAVLGLGVSNYLPTRLGLPALLLGLIFGVELWQLTHPQARATGQDFSLQLAHLGLAVSGWGAFFLMRSPAETETSLDGRWRHFRDRYGMVWGLRVLEQFNHAASHAGWPVRLTWWGTVWETAPPDDTSELPARLRHTLQATLKRFDPQGSDQAVEQPGPRTMTG